MYAILRNDEVCQSVAVKHGCVSKLVSLLRNRRVDKEDTLYCFSELVRSPPWLATAVQEGILPALFHVCEDEGLIDGECIEITLDIFRLCILTLPSALEQEQPSLRLSTIRKMVTIARSPDSDLCDEAKSLLNE